MPERLAIWSFAWPVCGTDYLHEGGRCWSAGETLVLTCLQGFHDCQLQEQIKLMQQHHNETEALTTMVLDQEVEVLQEAANAAVSQDIQHFTTYSIPQIQQLLSAKETLTSCWNVLPVDKGPLPAMKKD